MASPAVELIQQNDLIAASKSRMPLAPVDLLLVDNPCDENNKEVAEKCNHFSIRGHVSEVRKKDPKLCYPFTVKESNTLNYELPPMVVPKFRWWRCVSCVPEAKNYLQKYSCGAGNEEAQNDIKADSSILPVGQTSDVNNTARIRTTEASTSTDSNDNKNGSLIPGDRKGKGKAHVSERIPPSSGCENGFLKVSSSERIPQQTLGQVESHPSTDYTAELKSMLNQNGTTKALHKDCRAGRTEVGPSVGYLTREVDYVAKAFRGEPQTFSHHRADSPVNAVNVPDLNECSAGPSYEMKNEVMVTRNNINHFCEDDGNYMGAERRKKPKVRLLSELLGLKQTQNPAKGKKKILSSATSQDEHIKRKRVESQDEELKSIEARCNNRPKKIAGSSEMSGSEYIYDSDDVSTEKISKTSANKRRKSKGTSLDKKNKKIKVNNEDSSSLLQKMKPKLSHEKGKSSEESPQNLDFFTRLSEKNSVLTKKRGRIPQAQKRPTSPSKSGVPKEYGTTQKDGVAEQNATEIGRNASENGHYFLSNYLSKENDQLCVPRKDVLCLSSSQAEPMVVAGSSVQKDEENRNFADSSVTFKPIAGSVPSIINQFDGERTICPIANSSEKKAETCEADECSPLAQHMPAQVSNTVATQKDLTNEVRARIKDIDINSIPTDEKTNEQGVGDDIPMDIVELMAKNQYERHLNDPKDKHVISGPPLSGTIVKQKESNGSSEQHVNQIPQICKTPSKDPRIPMSNEDLGHYTYYNSNHLSIRGPPRENPVSVRVLSTNQGQDHSRPYSVQHGLAPNYWTADPNGAVGQRCPPSFIQAVGSYQKHKAMAPHPSITDSHRVWSPGMSSRMPLGITNPRLMSASSNALNKGGINHQRSGTFLNFDAASASAFNLKKQQNLNFSNAYNSGNAESSSKSVDANEAIPAMHLLSLMQNAAKIQITDLSLGPQKVVGPTSFRYPFSKIDSRTPTRDNSSHPCYPTAITTGHPFTLAYQNGSGNIGRTGTGFVGPIPLTLQGQRNMESSHFAASSGEAKGTWRPLRRPMGPPRDKVKGVTSMSKPSYSNDHVKTVKDVKDSLNLQNVAGVRRNEKTIPAPDKVICQLNRNPSEFNDLKLVARFMNGPDDLKPRKIPRNKVPRPRGIPKKQSITVFKTIPFFNNRPKQRKP